MDRIGVKRVAVFVDLPAVLVQVQDEVGADAGVAGDARGHDQLSSLSTFGKLEAIDCEGNSVCGCVGHRIAITRSENRVFLQGVMSVSNISHDLSSLIIIQGQNVLYFYYISKLIFCQYFSYK